MTPEIQIVMKTMGTPVDISNDEEANNETERMEILSDLNKLTHYAVQGNHVLIRTNKGRCLVEKRDIDGGFLVGFMYQEHNKPRTVCFWYNPNSVANIGDLLRENAGKRVSMQSLTQQ